MADLGNPNFFTTYIDGRGALELGAPCAMEKPYVMKTCNHVVQFLANAAITGLTENEIVFTLPEKFRPSTTVKLPCCFGDNVLFLNIGSDGVATIHSATGNGVLYLNGLSFNIAQNVY